MAPRSTLNVSLTAELVHLIGEDVSSGHYQSASDIIDAALQSFYEGRAMPDLYGPADGALARSREQVEALFAQAAAGMAQCDPTGRFVRVNDQFCAILGRRRDELLQLSMQDCTHPDDLAHNVTLFRRALKLGEAFEIEKRYLRPDGSVVWVRNAVSPVRDRSGTLDSLLAVSIDMTDYKNAQEDLRESEALKGSILEAALDCIISTDGESHIIEWNSAAEQTFGFTREAVLGQDLAGLIIPPEYRDRHRRGMAHYLATGEGPVLNRRIELEALRADGSRFPVELAISPISSGKGPRFTAYLRDITLRKQAEAEARESERRYREGQMELAHANRVATMAQLTGSIAHEVNQPIAATVASAQAALRWLARQSPDLDKVRQLLTQIVKNSTRASEIIHRIRDLIQKAPPRQDLLEISGPIREVIELTRAEAMKNRVSLKTELADGLPLVRGDRVQLQQVMLNLIVNAVDALSGVSDGEREVLISTGTDKSGGVLVTVRDSGPGLQVATSERVFEAFYTTKAAGMGMGLAISRSIIEGHGGRMWASANEPCGAVFQFTLPIPSNGAS
ncbi:PAS domain S-box protein (plasmid) [Microvirga terrae]|uniref:histidine kinase n=1 Tax=Microvirga terrae TaxID=2740529 RepID=A0ABY5S3C3_9HYPH|nr:PAS domain S-box protein [Microvirga terrae]UVF22719.1 PAS domain S-box protein [Microvirga terrae]